MPICKVCKEEVDELVSVRVKGRARRMCEDCAEEAREQEEIAAQSVDAMRRMMEYEG